MDKLVPGRERGEKTGCLQPAAAVAKPELPSRRGAAKDELGCWCSQVRMVRDVGGGAKNVACSSLQVLRIKCSRHTCKLKW